MGKARRESGRESAEDGLAYQGSVPPERQLALLIDLERCTGCRSCEAACKLEHRLGSEVARNRVLWVQYQDRPRLDMVFAVCQQCQRPACIRACSHAPKAIQKSGEDGVVRIDPTLCTGCQECAKACPYNAISFDFRTQKAQKCDLCSGRREHGFAPACVSVCPGRALTFGTVRELLEKVERDGRMRRNVDRFALAPSTVYVERVRGGGQPTVARTFVPAATREGRGTNHGRKAACASLLGKLPHLGSSRELYPYRGAPPIWEADRVESGGCNICFNSCSVRYYLKGNRVIAITGNPDDPVFHGRVCPKAQMQIQQFYSPHRLTHPLKRTGERGEAKFRRIGWDEALDHVADKLRRVRERYGPEALGIYTGTRAGILIERGAMPLFADLFGTPNRQSSGPFCGNSATVAWSLVQGVRGGANSYTPQDVGSAKLHLFVGDNMAETRPVYFGMVNDWALQEGARVVAVDPRLSVTASKADEWLPIRPGTDMALALAMMYHIMASGLVDRQFVEKWVLGYEEVSRFILARGYSPRWAEGITGIPAASIERLAREYATTDRAILYLSRGLTQHSNGTQTVRAFHMLCAVTGHWGRKGAGCMTIMNLPMGAKAPKERRAAKTRPAIRKSPAAWIEAMETGKPYPLKALIMATNPFVFWPDQARLRQAIRKVDLVVHLELWPNESHAWADYVFPGASSIEMGEVNRGCDDRRLVWIPKLIDPPGDARPDTYFWIELGKRFGFDDVLREEHKDSERFWDDLMLSSPSMKGMTVSRLRCAPWSWARGPLPTEDFEERETLFQEGTAYPGDAKGRRFLTPSGKLELWTPEMESKFQLLGMTALPEFYSEPERIEALPHLEWLTTDADEGVQSPFWRDTCADLVRIPQQPGPTQRYDTELVTGRPPAGHFHSWTHYWWQSQEMWPDLYVQIHPKKAASLDIEDGDRVVVETTTGSIEAVAWVYPGIWKDAVYLPIGWGERQPYNPWKGINWLVSKDRRDPASDQANFKTIPCRIRKP